MNLKIRKEAAADHAAVEALTREAFWNLYAPGCDEHYLVHLIRSHEDYIPVLNFVALRGSEIVGHIIFTKSYILANDNARHETITFGPVSVLPTCQGQGIGSALIRHAANEAAALGYRAITIYGYPEYYKRLGFHHGKTLGVSNPEGRFPYAHLILPLCPGAMDGISGKAYESPVFQFDPEKALAYDAAFPPKERLVTDSQEQFQKAAATFL